MNLPRVLIAAPPYTTTSAGIRVLHELADALVSLGYDASLLIMSGGQFHIANEPRFFSNNLKRTPISNNLEKIGEILRDGILVYPEIVSGNPLGARHVVRWFLNKEATMTGQPTNYTQEDFCLAYHRLFKPDAHDFLLKPSFASHFHSGGTLQAMERAVDLTYEGKTPESIRAFTIPNSIRINRGWPSSQTELATLLRSTRYFFSWDSVSAINIEALLSGAIPVLLQWCQITSENLDCMEFGPIPRLDVHLDGEKVYLSTDISGFLLKRDAFVANLKRIEDSWLDETARVFIKIREFFNM